MKKAQIVVYDFIFGFIIFIVIISMGSILWFTNNARVSQEIEQQERMRVAHDIINILINSPGYPERWEIQGMHYCKDNDCVIGFANNKNLLSELKIKNFKEFVINPADGFNGYDRTRRLFNIYDTYDYQLILRYRNGTIMEQIGNAPNNEISASVTRIAQLNDHIMKLELTIY